ncbi:hypothetical protein HHI36_012763 [Cryptolaemus montrouzieri]|uniref:Uncharacterized protein n=1 Tax=Cryptolaemus montrouzieri TaxID=559131 RepID=A0ABD2NG93_9CUCU
MNQMLNEIEGSINALPQIASESLEESETIQQMSRILWRISEESTENTKSTKLIENTIEETNSQDIKNDTFIIDSDDERYRTFNISEVAAHDQETNETNLFQNVDNKTEEPNLELSQENESEDEGIEDITVEKVEGKKHKNVRCYDDRIKTLSDAIYEYLQQQCFEIKELVLFPEILHDPNLNKLLAKLKNMYDDFYSNNLTNEEKNELRVNISTNILGYLENDSYVNADTSNDSSLLNIVSDKVFTITEFVSEILDNFFKLISESTCLVMKEDSSGENFLEFTQPFRDANGNLLHSTPQSPLEEEENNKTTDVITPKKVVEVSEITSFKKEKSKISGAEAYWITCSASPQKHRDLPKTPRHVVNIDDIPLRPPEDLLNITPSNKDLYLIPEEPRCELFGDSHDDDYESDNLNIPDCYRTAVDKIDILAGGDGSYVSFHKPETNVVMHNEVQFFRICTVNSSSYVKTGNIVLQKNKISDNESDESFYSVNGNTNNVEGDEEGDWMGYEMAKF